MSAPEGRAMSLDRILLIIVTVLLVIAIIFIAVTQLTSRSTGEAEQPAPVEVAGPNGDSTQPPAPPTFPPADAPLEVPPDSAEEATPTSGVQRLVLEATPTPFSVSSDDPRIILNLADPDYTDFFNDPKTWYTYSSEQSSGKATYRIEDGVLIGEDLDAEDTGLYWTYTSAQSGRVYVEITATNGDCAARDAVGLVMRVQADVTPSGYALEISCDGAYRLIRFREAGRPTATLIDWTASDAINQGLGARNRISLWGYDGKFYLFVNNTMLNDFFDNGMPYSYGFFATYVRSQVTYPLSATFDDFAFWHIPFIP